MASSVDHDYFGRFGDVHENPIVCIIDFQALGMRGDGKIRHQRLAGRINHRDRRRIRSVASAVANIKQLRLGVIDHIVGVVGELDGLG